jgi:hypothetical protein
MDVIQFPTDRARPPEPRWEVLADLLRGLVRWSDPESPGAALAKMLLALVDEPEGDHRQQFLLHLAVLTAAPAAAEAASGSGTVWQTIWNAARQSPN